MGAVTLTEYREQELRYLELEIPVDRDVLEHFTLDLALLLRGLADRLRLLSPGEPTRLEASAVSALTLANDVYVVGLTREDLSRAVDFLLVYHRDGAADVDHMHIELASEEADDVEVTIRVDRSKPAGTAEEARRVLLDDDSD